VKDAQKPDHVSLNTLVDRLKEGRFVIPDFQREFEWEPWDIRELMRSIFLDYYIGSLLLWKGSKHNFDTLACEPIYGYDGDERPEYIVLDGQQRLTAMYYTFLSPNVSLPKRSNRASYYIQVDKFMNEEYDDAFHYNWYYRYWTEVLNSRDLQFEKHVFPLSVVGDGPFGIVEWIREYAQYWQQRSKSDSLNGAQARKHARNAEEFGSYVMGIAGKYQISYIELDQDLAVDKVCDIFTRINSRGVRLDAFDLINALLKPKGLQLKHMWREAAPRLIFVDTSRMNVYILQVMSILRQAYCSPKYLYFLLPGEEKSVRDPDGTRRTEVLIPDAEDFECLWEEAVNALETALDLLSHPQEFGAISSDYLPYVSIIPAFAALQAHVRTLPVNQRLDAQRKIRHWYWASVFTNRYSGSVESTTARDFLDVKVWIQDPTQEPALLQEFKSRFRTLELRSETRRGTSVYNGVFNLLVLQGARDWMTGTVPQPDDLDDHHIVPRSWGREHLDGDLINNILNRTALTAETNREIIGDSLPNSYLPELVAENGEAEVRVILASHFISPIAQEILMRDPFTPNDFEAFIAERQRTIQEAIESLLIRERLDLSPQLRELDQRIEQVELGLREVIERELEGDLDKLPSHVRQKAQERIQRARKKDASMDAQRYETLAGLLEFADLRELQDTLVNRSLWPRFEPHFVSKQALVIKFDQLAELRNSIRHSRSASEIVSKEGEAAILWFEQVLAK
jgi:hypothetical protein